MARRFLVQMLLDGEPNKEWDAICECDFKGDADFILEALQKTRNEKFRILEVE